VVSSTEEKKERRDVRRSEVASLRSYHRPRLRVFGALRDLTAAGSGDKQEKDDPGPKGPDPKKRP